MLQADDSGESFGLPTVRFAGVRPLPDGGRTVGILGTTKLVTVDTAAAESAIVEALRPIFDAFADAIAERLAERLGAQQTVDATATHLDYRAAAHRCGLPVSAIRRAAARGEVAVVRLGTRSVRLAVADLDKWLARRRIAARDEPPRLRAAGGGR